MRFQIQLLIRIQSNPIDSHSIKSRYGSKSNFRLSVAMSVCTKEECSAEVAVVVPADAGGELAN